MIAGLMRYAGSAAKVRALYGKRLSDEDFRAMAAMRSVPDVTAFLKAHPGWRRALAGIEPSTIHRGQLEDALRQGMLDEHFRISRFMFSSGVELYQEPILRVEQEEILACYSRIRAGGAQGGTADGSPAYVPKLPDAYRKSSRIDFKALATCTDWDSLLAAVAKTGFHPILSHLNVPESGLPDYASVEWVMQTYVFSRLFSIAKHRASGQTRRSLEAFTGAQVDLINICRVMRIRSYFAEDWQNYISLLLPFSGKLAPHFLSDLYAAPDEESSYRILRSSPYKRIFAQSGYRHIEEYYYHYLYDFSRRMLRASMPSAFTAIAYLTLMEIEVLNVIKTTECVRYGKSPEAAGVFLVGMES